MTAAPATADLIITSATIWDGRHLDGVDSLAIGQDQILAVGNHEDISALASRNATVIDVGGRRVIPGLIDSHIHMVRAGLRWSEIVRWNEVRSMTTALERITAATIDRVPWRWIGVLGGWHPGQFDTGRPPTLAELDEAAPDHPVYVQKGYTEGFLNSTALSQIDLGDDIDRSTGRLTGPAAMAAGNAMFALPDMESQTSSTRSMLSEFNRLGLTGAIDTGGFGMSPDLYTAMSNVLSDAENVFRLPMLVGPGSPGGEQEQLERWMGLVSPGDGDDFFRYIGAGEVLLFAAHDMEDPPALPISGFRVMKRSRCTRAEVHGSPAKRRPAETSDPAVMRISLCCHPTSLRSQT